MRNNRGSSILASILLVALAGIGTAFDADFGARESQLAASPIAALGTTPTSAYTTAPTSAYGASVDQLTPRIVDGYRVFYACRQETEKDKVHQLVQTCQPGFIYTITEPTQLGTVSVLVSANDSGVPCPVNAPRMQGACSNPKFPDPAMSCWNGTPPEGYIFYGGPAYESSGTKLPPSQHIKNCSAGESIDLAGSRLIGIQKTLAKVDESERPAFLEAVGVKSPAEQNVFLNAFSEINSNEQKIEEIGGQRDTVTQQLQAIANCTSRTCAEQRSVLQLNDSELADQQRAIEEQTSALRTNAQRLLAGEAPSASPSGPLSSSVDSGLRPPQSSSTFLPAPSPPLVDTRAEAIQESRTGLAGVIRNTAQKAATAVTEFADDVYGSLPWNRTEPDTTPVASAPPIDWGKVEKNSSPSFRAAQDIGFDPETGELLPEVRQLTMTPAEIRAVALEDIARIHLQNLEKTRAVIDSTMNDPSLRTDPKRRGQIDALVKSLTGYEISPGVSQDTANAIRDANANIIDNYYAPYADQYAALGGGEPVATENVASSVELSAIRDSGTGGLLSPNSAYSGGTNPVVALNPEQPANKRSFGDIVTGGFSTALKAREVAFDEARRGKAETYAGNSVTDLCKFVYGPGGSCGSPTSSDRVGLASMLGVSEGYTGTQAQNAEMLQRARIASAYSPVTLANAAEQTQRAQSAETARLEALATRFQEQERVRIATIEQAKVFTGPDFGESPYTPQGIITKDIVKERLNYMSVDNNPTTQKLHDAILATGVPNANSYVDQLLLEGVRSVPPGASAAEAETAMDSYLNNAYNLQLTGGRAYAESQQNRLAAYYVEPTITGSEVTLASLPIDNREILIGTAEPPPDRPLPNNLLSIKPNDEGGFHVQQSGSALICWVQGCEQTIPPYVGQDPLVDTFKTNGVTGIYVRPDNTVLVRTEKNGQIDYQTISTLSPATGGSTREFLQSVANTLAPTPIVTPATIVASPPTTNAQSSSNIPWGDAYNSTIPGYRPSSLPTAPIAPTPAPVITPVPQIVESVRTTSASYQGDSIVDFCRATFGSGGSCGASGTDRLQLVQLVNFQNYTPSGTNNLEVIRRLREL